MPPRTAKPWRRSWSPGCATGASATGRRAARASPPRPATDPLLAPGVLRALGVPGADFRIGLAAHGNDWLYGQLETVFVQRRLQLPQPLDIAALACHDLVASGVDMNLPPALLLGHVAGRVRGAHDILYRAARMRDLDETDRDADVENLVFPDEAIIRDRIADIGSDLSCFLDRTADKQGTKFITTQSGENIGLT